MLLRFVGIRQSLVEVLYPTSQFFNQGRSEAPSFAVGHYSEASLYYTNQLPQPLEEEVTRLFPWFRRKSSKTASSTYWMNACVRCGASQGDWHLHELPSGAFGGFATQDGSYRENIVQGQVQCSMWVPDSISVVV